jgi:hypothetical protein
MTCNASDLGVVDFDGSNRTNLCLLNIEEATGLLAIGTQNKVGDILLYIMCRSVHNSVEQHSVCDLSMKPLRFIERNDP